MEPSFHILRLSPRTQADAFEFRSRLGHRPLHRAIGPERLAQELVAQELVVSDLSLKTCDFPLPPDRPIFSVVAHPLHRTTPYAGNETPRPQGQVAGRARIVCRGA